MPANQLNPLKTEFGQESHEHSNAEQSARFGDRQPSEPHDEQNEATRWRRVGLVTGSAVRLDTIVWPGGDIIVSGEPAADESIRLQN